MTREETLKQIAKMISSGDIPKEIYDKYLSSTPIGFMNSKELFEYLENQELKKQLETYETYFNRFFKINNKTYDGKIVLGLLDKKETQQKEFIEFLEAMSRMYQNEYKDINTAEHYNCVLQKYKEIIGDDKE